MNPQSSSANKSAPTNTTISDPLTTAGAPTAIIGDPSAAALSSNIADPLAAEAAASMHAVGPSAHNAAPFSTSTSNNVGLPPPPAT